MPTFLSDPPPTLYAVLILAVLAMFGIWFRYRKRSLLLMAVITVVLVAAVFLIDRFKESPREQSIRSITEMAAAIQHKDWATFSSHVSEQFNANGMTKKPLENFFRLGAERYNIRATAWDFAIVDPPAPTETEIVIRFDAKAEASTGEPALKHFTARFVKEGDRFRMITFTPFNYVMKQSPEPFPGSIP